MAVCAVVLFSNIVMILLSYYSSRQDEAALFLYKCIGGDVKNVETKFVKNKPIVFSLPFQVHT